MYQKIQFCGNLWNNNTMHKPIKSLYALLIITIIGASFLMFVLKEINRKTIITEPSVVTKEGKNISQVEVPCFDEAGYVIETGTQMGITHCSGVTEQRIRNEMNEVYSEVLLQFDNDIKESIERDDSDYVSILKKNKGHIVNSQKLWLQYEEEQCEAEGMLYEGGSIKSSVVNQCYANLHKQRITTLQVFLEDSRAN